LQLDSLALPEDVITVSLEAQRLAPFAPGNRSLFQTPGAITPGAKKSDIKHPGVDRSDLSDLVDQLRARLGERACHGIAHDEQHVPEQAWRKTLRIGGGFSGTGKSQTGKSQKDLARPRPFWLFDPPRPVERVELNLLRGPERIQTAWWHKSVFRDYYVARHGGGTHCWAFVDAHDCWFLHGYFA
jgi:protein ImuB